ncbi:MAG: hypothetical protein HY964_05785 [Ignavibacteriales bacterium]|nr:hypothetical protein [Ignavibacteriales bacterium]
MARKIFYKILNDNNNQITNKEWDDVLKLQHWYNSEFIWTAGKLGFRMYAVFPNLDYNVSDVDELHKIIHERKRTLKSAGLTENESIQKLEEEGLVIAQKGGYVDNCLASGFTRVAGNEFNAYLVCDFLLKCSLLLQQSSIIVNDEGIFIKSKEIIFNRGNVIFKVKEKEMLDRYHQMIINRHIFSVVDPAKYNNFPEFKNNVYGFDKLDKEERGSVLTDWNWLGFSDNFDLYGDDVRGYDLNKKIKGFFVEIV